MSNCFSREGIHERVNKFAVIPVSAILLLSLSGKETIIVQDHADTGKSVSSPDAMQSIAIVENSADERQCGTVTWNCQCVKIIDFNIIY